MVFTIAVTAVLIGIFVMPLVALWWSLAEWRSSRV